MLPWLPKPSRAKRRGLLPNPFPCGVSISTHQLFSIFKGKGFSGELLAAVVLRQHQQQAEFHRPHEQTGFGSGNGVIRFSS